MLAEAAAASIAEGLGALTTAASMPPSLIMNCGVLNHRQQLHQSGRKCIALVPPSSWSSFSLRSQHPTGGQLSVKLHMTQDGAHSEGRISESLLLIHVYSVQM